MEAAARNKAVRVNVSVLFHIGLILLREGFRFLGFDRDGVALLACKQ
jgi:hypothetical protein